MATELLSKTKIGNLKAFKGENEIEFAPMINLVFGKNSSGKSTIIDIICGLVKNENVNVPVGLFTTDEYRDVSAVIYSSLATWGKIRAVADNPDAMTVYNTLHPPLGDSMIPEIRFSKKSEYFENIADGLHILHNPYAERPLDISVFNHERVAQYFLDPEKGFDIVAPDDFLLLRQLQSFITK